MKTQKLLTQDKIKIEINYYNRDNDSVVIICPGWFMTKDSKIFKNISSELAKHFDVITMDFRGHGKSGGRYTFTSKEDLDLKAVTDFAKSKDYKNIYLMGFSLGGALSIIYGAKPNNGISKIIAISAPSDFYKIENRMYSPDAWIPTIFQKFEPLRWLTIRPGNPFSGKIKPIEVVKDIKCPTLFIAGEKDPTVLPWHTKALYEKAHCTKDYILFKNARHAEDLYSDYPKKFIQCCINWLSA